MRKILLLTLCLCLLVSPALGETAGEQEALSRTELIAWRAALLQTLKTLPVQNNPSETNDPNGSDTWLYAYDFGMVELGRESLEGEGNPIESVEVLTTGVSCPRDVEVGDTLETVLAAYPNENPTLSGDASYAALYVREDGTLEDGNGWGWVLRRGSTVDCVQYAASAPAEGLPGYREEVTVRYLIENGVVASIQISGFDQLISDAESLANLASVQEISAVSTYTPSGEPVSGGPFAAADLSFDGLDFTAAPETFQAVLGAPLSDETSADGAVRTLTYAGALVECVQVDGQWRASALLAMQAGVPGPRGVVVGDALEGVLTRFGADAQTLSGATVPLYGEAGEGDWGLLSDGEGGSRVAEYVCVTDEGTYGLRMTFFDGVMSEYLLYRQEGA